MSASKASKMLWVYLSLQVYHNCKVVLMLYRFGFTHYNVGLLRAKYPFFSIIVYNKY